MEQVYPAHLYQEMRRAVAVDYLRHELRKYLPSLLDQDAWEKIDADIDSWFSRAPFLYPVRDFWNGVHGMMMGFKLYNQLLAFITAENMAWELRDIDLTELTFGTLNPLVKEVGIEREDVALALAFYQKEENQATRQAHIQRLKGFFDITAPRRDQPIIVTQKRISGEDKLVVYDGNGRATWAVLQGKDAIRAYIGKFTDDRREPMNYWLPTSLLMEVVEFAKKAWAAKDEDLYRQYAGVLKHTLTYSQSGVYEMKERVIPHDSDFKTRVFSDLEI